MSSYMPGCRIISRPEHDMGARKIVTHVHKGKSHLVLSVSKPQCNSRPASVRNAKDVSLQVKGAQLFNCIPGDMRDTSQGTVE